MNALSKGTHSMRIIALPLARVKMSRDSRANTSFHANPMLVFYHFDLISSLRGHEDLSWRQRALNNVVKKTTDLWTNLGKAPKGSWKLWTYELGERIADRIDFEELALRNIDPSLGPPVPRTGSSQHVSDVTENRSQLPSLPKIPFIYPPSLYPACLTAGDGHNMHPPLAHLQTLLATRVPQHRRWLYLWMLIAPLTAPIAMIPLIPNFPFFFCIWRSWSHYRAYRSSQYLSSLLEHGLIEPDPSSTLDKLYASVVSSSRTSQKFPPPTLAEMSSEKESTTGNLAADGRAAVVPVPGTEPSQSERIYLTREAVPHILKVLHFDGPTTGNLYRAVDQAHGRLRPYSSSGFL